MVLETTNRNGKRWNTNELLQLEREYELLELNVQQIALKHLRTVDSIIYRLESEGIIDGWENARGFSPRRSPRNKT
uniref:Uncharacterized protein n=1 Tax=viral metagenome TaxID=1070528 RepID=A0A6C0E3J1_9ZZZZ